MPDRPAPLVLVVEDNAELREICAATIRGDGLRVEVAGDGIEGVQKAIALRPDVILMDLDMPRLDGLAATVQLKADVRTSGVPVILFTGQPPEEKARAAGCAGLLRKPSPANVILAAIRAQLRA